jgi:hypothetical protein
MKLPDIYDVVNLMHEENNLVLGQKTSMIILDKWGIGKQGHCLVLSCFR